MIVKRYVDKKVIWLIFAVMVICSAAMLYMGTLHRFTYAAEYENYAETEGLVHSLQRYEHEDSDESTYYTYSAEIEYIVDGINYTQFTDDIFSEENVPEKGQCVPILYNKDDPKDYAVAKHDWMTRSSVPIADKGDQWLLLALLCLGFSLILMAMAIDNDDARGIILGFGLLLIGIDGVVMGAIIGEPAMFLLVVFGAAGAFVLYRYLFVPKERRQREEEISESLRIFKVVDICEDPQNRRNIIVFSMMENDGIQEQLFSYDDYNYRFQWGDIYQISKNDVQGFYGLRQIHGIDTIDITGINQDAIQPINPMLNKLISRLGE